MWEKATVPHKSEHQGDWNAYNDTDYKSAMHETKHHMDGYLAAPGKLIDVQLVAKATSRVCQMSAMQAVECLRLPPVCFKAV